MLEIIQIINTGVLLTCALIILLNPHKTNLKGNRWLGLFLFFLFVQLFQNVNSQLKLIQMPEFSTVLVFLCLYSIPVSFYLCIRLFISPHHKLEAKDLIHAFVHVLYLSFVAVFFIKNKALLIFSGHDQALPLGKTFFTITLAIFLLSTLLYWLLGFLKLKSYSSRIKFYSAATEEVNLKWLHNINYGYILMTLLWMAAFLSHLQWVFILANLAYGFGAFYMVWNSLLQKELYPIDQKENQELQAFIQASLPGDKVARTPQGQVHTGEDTLLKTKLLEYMQREQPYLDNDLNLIRLAHLIGVSNHKLSYLLNKVLETNFSSFVNKYRAENAMQIILDPEKSHFTMLQIAYEAGYNSKTVFNTHFKKVTSMTPSAYRNKHVKG